MEKMIKVDSVQKISAALDAVQGRCSVRMRSAADIKEKADELEKRLELSGLAKKDRPGAEFIWSFYEKKASAYKWAFEGTRITFFRRPGLTLPAAM